MCAQLAIKGSSSNVCNNITVSCKLFNVNRDAISSIKISKLYEPRVTRSDTSSLVLDLLNIKYKNLFIPRSLHTISNDLALTVRCEN